MSEELTKTIDNMTKAELLAMAGEKTIEGVNADMKVADIKAVIKTALNLPDEPKTTEPVKASTKDFNTWATELRTPSWQLSAAVAVNKWAKGKQLTEAQFLDGLKKGMNRPIG